MVRSIRVFLSSTFLDMQEERNYLNRVIFPKFKLICQQRGVSFFACDLRWGITEAQAQNKQTIELCLNQVEQCIPFFIGLFGNRYGWIPDKDDVSSSILDWYDDSLHYSATEIEFSYYCRRVLTFDNSLFAKKGNSLLCPEYDDSRPEMIDRFLKRIQQLSGKELYLYESLEQLGDKIYAVLCDWIDTLFPTADIQTQMIHYHELLDSRNQEHDVLENWQRAERAKYGNQNAPKELYNPYRYAGDSYFGYEVFCNAISRYKLLALIEPDGSEMICNRYWHYYARDSYNVRNVIEIYLDASPELRNAHKMCTYLRDTLLNLYPDLLDEAKDKVIFLSNDSLESLREEITSILVNIPKERSLAICFTNMHLMNENDIYYNLSFLGCYYGEHVSIYISTNDRSQTILLSASGEYTIRNYPVKIKEAVFTSV